MANGSIPRGQRGLGRDFLPSDNLRVRALQQAMQKGLLDQGRAAPASDRAASQSAQEQMRRQLSIGRAAPASDRAASQSAQEQMRRQISMMRVWPNQMVQGFGQAGPDTPGRAQNAGMMDARHSAGLNKTQLEQIRRLQLNTGRVERPNQRQIAMQLASEGTRPSMMPPEGTLPSMMPPEELQRQRFQETPQFLQNRNPTNRGRPPWADEAQLLADAGDVEGAERLARENLPGPTRPVVGMGGIGGRVPQTQPMPRLRDRRWQPSLHGRDRRASAPREPTKLEAKPDWKQKIIDAANAPYGGPQPGHRDQFTTPSPTTPPNTQVDAGATQQPTRPVVGMGGIGGQIPKTQPAKPVVGMGGVGGQVPPTQPTKPAGGMGGVPRQMPPPQPTKPAGDLGGVPRQIPPRQPTKPAGGMGGVPRQMPPSQPTKPVVGMGGIGAPPPPAQPTPPTSKPGAGSPPPPIAAPPPPTNEALAAPTPPTSKPGPGSPAPPMATQPPPVQPAPPTAKPGPGSPPPPMATPPSPQPTPPRQIPVGGPTPPGATPTPSPQPPPPTTKPGAGSPPPPKATPPAIQPAPPTQIPIGGPLPPGASAAPPPPSPQPAPPTEIPVGGPLPPGASTTPQPPTQPFNPNDEIIADYEGQPPVEALPPDATAPLDFNTQVQQFLAQQLSGGMTGDDAMTQSALADFDVGAERARRQQIEDLQRFGVLGGSGVSSGAVADILGEFDAATQRGRAGVRAQGLNRVLQSILPQATGMATQQAALAQQQAQFGQTLAERQAARGQQAEQFGLGQELDRERLAQQDVQFGLGQELDRERLDQQAGQFASAQELARQQALGSIDGQETILARQLEQDRALREAAITGQLDGADTLAAQQLAQQQEQFGRSMDLDEQRRLDQVNQELAQRNLQAAMATGVIPSGVTAGGVPYGGQETLAARQLRQQRELEEARMSQQADQFETTAGMDQERIDLARGEALGLIDGDQTVQAQQLAADLALRQAALTGDLDGTETLDAQRLAQQQTQFEDQQALAEAAATGMFDGTETLDAKRFAAADELARQAAAREEEQFRVRDPISIALAAADQENLDPDLRRRVSALASELPTDPPPTDPPPTGTSRTGTNEELDAFYDQDPNLNEGGNQQTSRTKSGFLDSGFQLLTPGKAGKPGSYGDFDLPRANISKWDRTDKENVAHLYNKIHDYNQWPDIDITTNQLESLAQEYGAPEDVRQTDHYSPIESRRERATGPKGYRIQFENGKEIVIPSLKEQGKPRRTDPAEMRRKVTTHALGTDVGRIL